VDRRARAPKALTRNPEPETLNAQLNPTGKWTDGRVRRELFHDQLLAEGQRIVMKCVRRGCSDEEDAAVLREVLRPAGVGY
jgi:hypothetical protein